VSNDLLPARGGQMARRHLADGDRTTLDELYETYASRLLSRLMRKWRLPSHAAQDALQDTFVQGAQAMHKIEDTDKVGAWLTKIADRQAMAIYRRGTASGQRETPSGSPADLESQAGSSAAADDHATTVVDEMVLRAAVKELPPKLGSVVNLYYFEGLTLAEIGHVLGCGAPAAHRLLSVARERLTKELSAFSAGAQSHSGIG
jgi:RNA polymerase sigma factor (sigma-70 family)